MTRLTNLRYFATFFVFIFSGEILECQGALQKVNIVWSSPITYFFDDTAGYVLPDAKKTIVRNVLSGYVTAVVPGLTFSESGSTPTTTPYIKFSLDTARTIFCEDENTEIGVQSDGIAEISITVNSYLDCSTQGWILHLLMHALGFYHEHQRPDRGNYVYVNNANSNLPTSAQSLFLDVQSGAVIVNSASYDYASVTHYDYQAAAKSGKITVVALPPEYISIKSYGHATSSAYSASSVLSTSDIAALRALFPGTSTITTQSCNNGGTWYNWCICKPGFAGPTCSETYCYQTCQNSGYCSISATTSLPSCVCPTGYSGTYCEIIGTSPNCSTSGSCPWWSACNAAYMTCTCDPYPYYGPICSIPIVSVPTTSTVSTPSTASTSTTTVTATSASTTSTIACTAANVGAPRSVTWTANAVYLRIALYDIPYISDYSNLGSSSSVALQNFLAEAFQGDYQTQTSGQFISILVQNIQPPISGATSGCSVVDFLAKFTSNLAPSQRTRVVQATYSKSTSSNLPSLFGTLGTNPNKATIVSSVLYITPLNSAISPASPCVVYSSEGACKNGGTCTGSGTDPTCVCSTGFSGALCDASATSSGVTLNWPIWQIVVVSIAAAVALLLFILLVAYFVRQAQGKNWYNYMWNSPDRYYDYDMRARQMQMAPTYMVPAEPPQIHPSYYAQPAGYGPTGNSGAAMPPPYPAGNGYQRQKHYQYPYNIQ